MYTILNKRILSRLALGVLLLSLSCSVMAQQRAVPVTTSPIQDIVTFPVRNAPATTVSLNDASISAQITGTILEIPVQVGDVVEQGDLITRLDCVNHVLLGKQAQASLQAAQAKNKFAQSQMLTAQKLSKTKNISRENLNQRKADIDTTNAEVVRLESALQSAERNVEKCEVRAPFKAVVVERLASIGEYAIPGTVIMRLLDQQNIEISAMVQEQDLAGLQEASSLQFESKNHSYPLKLRSILPLMESKLSSYEVRLTFSEQMAQPGSAGRLEWQTEVPHLPPALLVNRSDKLGVFIAKDNHAHFYVIDNAREGRPAPTTLSGKSDIILDGRFGLMDGDAIEITQP